MSWTEENIKSLAVNKYQVNLFVHGSSIGMVRESMAK